MSVAAHEVRIAELPTGAAVAYTDSGGDGPAIVFSHGFLLDHTMFDAQVDALLDRWRVITWDGRGHGETRSSGPFSYWDSARDLLALLDALGIGSAVLAGMSQGGFLSLRAALLEPARVRALVLIDTQAGGEDPEIAPLYEAMHRQWVDEGPTEELAATVVGIILSDDPRLLAEWVPKALARPKEALTEPFRCLMDREDISARLGEITVPALVIHGTADAAIPLEKAQRLAAELPGARPLVLVEGGAHASNVTHPDRVNAAIEEFLGSL